MKMHDFFEILNYCAYDVDKSNKIAQQYCTKDVIKEALDEVGLETLSKQSSGENGWRLLCESDFSCSWR